MTLTKCHGAPTPAVIGEVRQFNRFYTRQIGLLEREYLQSPFTLAEVRVLYELASSKSTTATAIARDLGLDVGYLSRILKLFERRKYIKRERAGGDNRQYNVRLTPLGRRAFLPLNRAARKQVAVLLAPLCADSRNKLVESMRSIQGLLEQHAPEAKTLNLRGLRAGDAGWITHRQALLYQQEYGWDMTYEALVSEILAKFLKSYDPTSEGAWVAEQSQKIVGCVFLVRASPTVAKLRLLYVEPHTRGLGVGRRLVDECIAFARARGYGTLTLWTNDVLVAARKIYQAAGFQLIKEEPHHSFGKDLIGQTWELALQSA